MLRKFVGVGFHSPQGKGTVSRETAIKERGEEICLFIEAL